MSTQDLCAALSQCCALCGRSVGAHDMYLHLRHHHARDNTRGSLFYRYLVDMTPQTHHCSVCNLRTTAAHECPILWPDCFVVSTMDIEEQDQNAVQQMWGVLRALASFREDEDGSRHQSKRQKAAHFPSKGRGKGKSKQEPTGTPTNRGSPQHCADLGTPLPSSRRRSERSGHGAGLQAFFEPRSREHHVEDDAGHGGMVPDGTKGPHLATQDQGPTSPAGRVDEPGQEASSRSTRRRLGEDFDQVSVPHTGGEQQRSPLQLSAMEHHHESTGDRSGPPSPHHGTHDQPTHQDPDLHRHSAEMHSAWQELTHSGVWQLVLGRMRQLTWAACWRTCDHRGGLVPQGVMQPGQCLLYECNSARAAMGVHPDRSLDQQSMGVPP